MTSEPRPVMLDQSERAELRAAIVFRRDALHRSMNRRRASPVFAADHVQAAMRRLEAADAKLADLLERIAETMD